MGVESGCWRLGSATEGYRKDFWDAENVLYLDCGSGYTTVCIQNYKLKKVNFIYIIP